jgi:hypothetical protein
LIFAVFPFEDSETIQCFTSNETTGLTLSIPPKYGANEQLAQYDMLPLLKRE